MGHELMSFMDAFLDYRQIPLAKEVQEKTSSITNTDLYCYNVISFGSKNDAAAYQQLFNKVFTTLIVKMMEVYVNDMITKGIKEANHVQDVEETFKILKSYAIKLNPKKCTSSVRLGKFLRCMIDQ